MWLRFLPLWEQDAVCARARCACVDTGTPQSPSWAIQAHEEGFLKQLRGFWGMLAVWSLCVWMRNFGSPRALVPSFSFISPSHFCPFFGAAADVSVATVDGHTGVGCCPPSLTVFRRCWEEEHVRISRQILADPLTTKMQKGMRLNDGHITYLAVLAKKDGTRRGCLSKKSSDNTKWHSKWFALLQNMLFYFENDSSSRPSGLYLLEGCACDRAPSPKPSLSAKEGLEKQVSCRRLP